MTCKARRINDEMHCHACGLVWDVSDADRPACRPRHNLAVFAGALLFALSGSVSAGEWCDGSLARDALRASLPELNQCHTASVKFGTKAAATSPMCMSGVAHFDTYTRELDRMVSSGCVYYYNGPSKTELKHLDIVLQKFKGVRT